VSGPTATWRRCLHPVLLLYVVGLVPRLAFVLATGSVPLALDEIEYDRLAWSLAEGRGYTSFFGIESTFRPPGYPLFLAAVYLVTGPDYYAARIVQCFVTAALGPLTWLLARECFPARVAGWAGTIAALYPTIVLFTLGLMSENLFMPLLLLSVWLAIRCARAPGIGKAVALGLAMLAVVLIRSELTPLMLLLLGWIVWMAPSRQLALRHAAIAVVIVAIPVAGWSYRNYQVAGQFIFLDSRAGLNLYIAFNENATGRHHAPSYLEMRRAYFRENWQRAAPGLSREEMGDRYDEQWYAYRERRIPEPEGVDADALVGEYWLHDYAMERAIEEIREHPLHVLGLIPAKFRYFWNLEHRLLVFAYSNNVIGPLPNWALAGVLVLLLTPFALLTLGSILYLSLARCSWWLAPLLLPIAYLTALHTAIFADARYHYPIVPILAILATAAVVQWRSLRPRLHGLRAGVAGVAMIGAVAMWVYGLAESSERFAVIFGEDGHRTYLDL
jgi:4-amino-4-deoxy-L-arabinose transferase-like glycosyltransferase